MTYQHAGSSIKKGSVKHIKEIYTTTAEQIWEEIREIMSTHEEEAPYLLMDIGRTPPEYEISYRDEPSDPTHKRIIIYPSLFERLYRKEKSQGKPYVVERIHEEICTVDEYT